MSDAGAMLTRALLWAAGKNAEDDRKQPAAKDRLPPSPRTRDMFIPTFRRVLVACALLAGNTAPVRGDESMPLAEVVRPFAAAHCARCHGDAKAEAELHVGRLLKAERFDQTHAAWRKILHAVESRTMPPEKEPQPTDAERAAVVRAIRAALGAFAARAPAGDPGEVVLRRLTNAEYDHAIEDLTGFALAPSWRFPRNESSGEGFDNVAATLGVRSSELIEKYLQAADETAAHAFSTPSRGLHFLRVTATQSSRPQRAAEACAELKAFYDRVASELPRRAPLDQALVAAWRHRHRDRLAQLGTKEPGAETVADPRYLAWVRRQLDDPQAGLFQRQLLQEPFAALPAPGEPGSAPEEIAARCRRIAEEATLALHAPLGLSLKDLPNPTPYYLEGRRGMTQPRQIERSFAASESGGTTLFLVAGDAGVAPPAGGETDAPVPCAIWDDCTLTGAGKKTIRLVDLLREQRPPRVFFDELPDGRRVPKDAFAVPVPSLIRVTLPADFAPPKSGIACRAKFRLAEGPACVAQIGLLTQAPIDSAGRDLTETLPPGTFPAGRIVAGGEIRAGGEFRLGAEPQAFLQVWEAYDAFFRRFGLPHYPTQIDIAPFGRPGFSDAIGMYAVYGVPPERHLHRFEERDAWLRDCVLTAEEARRLEGLWADAFHLTDEHRQRPLRLTRLLGLHEKSPAEQETEVALRTVPEEKPRETPTWGGRPWYFRRPAPPSQRWAESRGAPDAWDRSVRARTKAELLAWADRAWRRPLDRDEQEGLVAVYERLRDEGLDDEAAMRRTLVRILVSPHFLLKVEGAVSGDRAAPVSTEELASRLSFFLWSSLPDDALRRVAADGSLLRDDVLRSQTERMLKDPKARRLAVEFFGQWLAFKGFDRHDRVDRERFPEFDEDLRREMHEETVLFVEDLIRSDRPVRELFFGTRTYLNVSLALHYGLDPTKLPWPKEAPGGYRNDWASRERIAKERAKGTALPLFSVEVDPRQRGGLLGMGSLLTAQSLSLRTSPVNRGKWLYEAVLGRDIPEPPPDAGVLPDDDQEEQALTLREQLERHRRTASCAACHARFDPLGFALEGYDAIGRRRTRDAAGRPIDDRGELAGKPIVGLPGVRAFLAEHEDEVCRNLARKLLGFALGRACDPADEILVDRIRDAARAADERFSAYATEIVLAPQFRHRRPADRESATPSSAATPSNRSQP